MSERKITDELRAVEKCIENFARRCETVLRAAEKRVNEIAEERRNYIDMLDDDLRAKARAIGILEPSE